MRVMRHSPEPVHTPQVHLLVSEVVSVRAGRDEGRTRLEQASDILAFGQCSAPRFNDAVG